MLGFRGAHNGRRNEFLPLVALSHRQTNKQTRIQQSLEPRYDRKAIFHLTAGGVNQCADLEEELSSFPKSPNDDMGDSAASGGDRATVGRRKGRCCGVGDEKAVDGESVALASGSNSRLHASIDDCAM